MEYASIEDLQEEILKLAPNVGITTIFYEKLNKNLLLTYSNGARSKIMIFDKDRGLNQIGSIIYAIRGERLFILEFEVDKTYQKNGLGRQMFNLALAHADVEGVTLAYGDADPINSFDGIEDDEENSFEQSKKELMQIYEKLGCTFGNYANENRFEIKWQEGERLQILDQQLQDFVHQIHNRGKEL